MEIASLPCGGREWVSSFIFVFIYLLFLRQIRDWNYSREQRSSLLSLMSHSSSLFLFIYFTPTQPVSIKIKTSIMSGRRRNFPLIQWEEWTHLYATLWLISLLLCSPYHQETLWRRFSVSKCPEYDPDGCWTPHEQSELPNNQSAVTCMNASVLLERCYCWCPWSVFRSPVWWIFLTSKQWGGGLCSCDVYFACAWRQHHTV